VNLVNLVNLVNFVRDLAHERNEQASIYVYNEKLINNKGFSVLGAVLGESDQALGEVHNVHEVHSGCGAAAEQGMPASRSACASGMSLGGNQPGRNATAADAWG
jgi:hypothetical protein